MHTTRPPRGYDSWYEYIHEDVRHGDGSRSGFEELADAIEVFGRYTKPADVRRFLDPLVDEIVATIIEDGPDA